MILNDKGFLKLLSELDGIIKHKPVPLPDLFKIRDALDVLDKYGLADKDLLQEVNKYIQDKELPLII